LRRQLLYAAAITSLLSSKSFGTRRLTNCLHERVRARLLILLLALKRPRDSGILYTHLLTINSLLQLYRFFAVQQSLSTKDIVRRTVLGLSTYTILEGGLFRTTFPSSSIALGAYANTRSMLRSSIISNSPVASDSQRRRIQQMGKRFGCHQCGNRQLLNNKGFIADHMPPTKRAEELSAAWWRRMMRLKVSFCTVSDTRLLN